VSGFDIDLSHCGVSVEGSLWLHETTISTKHCPILHA